ncbi:MAG: hypothetical protein JWN33_298 [Candidatus Saccharibacteria bacterium]|nr:hypothetical protein [Candidatus Saccharibacteria bacterium]
MAEHATVTPGTETSPSSPNPGQGFGIASLVTSLVGLGLVGLILGIIGINQSKKAGQKNGFALAGIIIGIANIIVATLFLILMAIGIFGFMSQCKDLGPGTHTVNGVEITCSAAPVDSGPSLYQN